MARSTHDDVSEIIDRITTSVSSEPENTILDAAYYVARIEPVANAARFEAERDMLRYLVFSRILTGTLATQLVAWDVVEELLDFVEENPRREESADG